MKEDTKLKDLENLRKQIRNNYLLIAIIYLIFIILVIYYLKNKILIMSILLILLFTFMIETYNVVNKISKKIKDYKKLYRNYYVQKTLPYINMNNLVYDENMSLVKKEIEQTELFEINKINTEYKSNNLIRGYKRKMYFSQGDLLLTKKDNNSNESPYKITFKGKYLIVTLPKQLKNNIRIIDKDISIRNKNNKIKIKTTTNFNKIFNVYSTSTEDTLNILNEKLQESIINIKKITNKKIMVCLKDNELHLAIYTNKESFLPTNVFIKINPEKSIQKIKEEFNLTEKILETLEYNDILK